MVDYLMADSMMVQIKAELAYASSWWAFAL